jgi:hypothetical protein
VQDALVAASVLVAVGLWAFALVRLPPHGSAPIAVDSAAAADSPASDPSAPDASTPDPSTIARLASATPRSLGSAIDGSLLGELENITQDALGAARFLAGRVPTPLVERETSSSPH